LDTQISKYYPLQMVVEKFRQTYRNLNLNISALNAIHSEVLRGSEAIISCVVSGLTKKLDEVKWEEPNSGGEITDGTDGYKIDQGTYDGDSHTQTTVLTVPRSYNIADVSYTCVIHSEEHKKSEEKIMVQSNVFSE
jgi:hypothetical protein